MGQSSGIGVLDKAMSVLVAVASEPGNLAELVDRTGLPRATAHRLAVALELHRMLVRDESGRWNPGPALAELALGAPDTLLAAAGPVLVRLRDETAESTQLYRRDRDVRICVAAEERAHGLRDTVPVGARLPMTAGSAAQVLIAWAEPADATDLLGRARFTARTVAEVRRRGWAASVGEREDGVASVSAPVFDPAGGLVAAISVSGPIGRLGRRPGLRLSPAVVAAGRALSRRL
jgi:DNA-binding IclR family transcriptional regulator